MIRHRSIIVFLMMIPMFGSSVLTRIHPGFLNFEYEDVFDSYESSSHTPYTLEVSLNDTTERDYVISSCFLNSCQFMSKYSCLNSNYCALRALETDSYNRENTRKQTLVHFYAHTDPIAIECDFIVLNCSGCAERSCHKPFDLNMYQASTVSYKCERENKGFVCIVKQAETVYDPFNLTHITSSTTTTTTTSTDTVDDSEDSSGTIDSFEATIFSDLVNQRSWVLIIVMFVIFVLLGALFIYCAKAKCFTIIDAEGNDLNYEAFRCMRRKMKNETVTQIQEEDKEYEENGLVLPKTEIKADNIVRASTLPGVNHDVSTASEMSSNGTIENEENGIVLPKTEVIADIIVEANPLPGADDGVSTASEISSDGTIATCVHSYNIDLTI